MKRTVETTLREHEVERTEYRIRGWSLDSAMTTTMGAWATLAEAEDAFTARENASMFLDGMEYAIIKTISVDHYHEEAVR